MLRKTLNINHLIKPDPPDLHPCLDILYEMEVKDQKELVLCPGDHISFKSTIYGNKYNNAVIKEIFPGPGRRIRLDIFESPINISLIQRYEIRDGKKVHMMPPAGGIMFRYWALVPGKQDHAACPFQEMASNFVGAAAIA